jgi:hypothetical protein
VGRHPTVLVGGLVARLHLGKATPVVLRPATVAMGVLAVAVAQARRVALDCLPGQPEALEALDWLLPLRGLL